MQQLIGSRISKQIYSSFADLCSIFLLIEDFWVWIHKRSDLASLTALHYFKQEIDGRIGVILLGTSTDDHPWVDNMQTFNSRQE